MAQHNEATHPLSDREDTEITISSSLSFPTEKNNPPFAAYLQLVALTASITVSVSTSASQGFATGGNLFGTSLGNDNDSTSVEAGRKTTASATWCAWSSATSSLSLMISLVLQLLLTDEFFVSRLAELKFHRLIICIGSWIALALQGIALALLGEALKVINHSSGAMIQWCLLAIGLPSFLLYIAVQYSARRHATSPSSKDPISHPSH